MKSSFTKLIPSLSLKKGLSTLLLALMISPVASAHDTEYNGVYFNVNLITREAEVTFGPTEYSGTVEIPSRFTFRMHTYSVTSIGKHAFEDNNNLTNVIIPESITLINDSAFNDCGGLTTVTLPEGVVTIGKGAFTESVLTRINIPNSVKTIEDYAFNNTDIEYITFGNFLQTIGEYAFYGCNLRYVTLPNSLTHLAENAFQGNHRMEGFYGKYASTDSRCLIVNDTLVTFAPAGITEYTLPNTVKHIGNFVFGQSDLNKVTIPNSVTSIGGFAFYNCKSLTSVTIPNSVTSIGGSAFSGCESLTNITIPNSVTSIGHWAFAYCEKLISITVPNSVKSIGKEAFRDCYNLSSVVLPNSLKSLGKSAFISYSYKDNIKVIYSHIVKPQEMEIEPEPVPGGAMFADQVFNDAILYVPNGTTANYRSCYPWSRFKNIVESDYASTGTSGVLGDINGDGEVSSADISALTRIILNAQK